MLTSDFADLNVPPSIRHCAGESLDMRCNTLHAYNVPFFGGRFKRRAACGEVAMSANCVFCHWRVGSGTCASGVDAAGVSGVSPSMLATSDELTTPTQIALRSPFA